jgi:hypothetical protein
MSDREGQSPAKHQLLLNYDTHAKVFEQVTAFHGQITTTLNLYLLASGGIWAFVLGAAGQVDTRVGIWALVLHIAISGAAASVCFGLGQTVLQRLNFLKALGQLYWKDIEDKGATASQAGWKWQVRHQVGIWFLIPLLGLAASAYLIGELKHRDQAKAGACAERLRAIESATTPLDFNRAVFLFNGAGCDSLGASQWP